MNTPTDTDPAPPPDTCPGFDGPDVEPYGRELAAGFRCTLKVEPYHPLDCPTCDSLGTLPDEPFEAPGRTVCFACGGTRVRRCEAAGFGCGAAVHRLVRCGDYEAAVCNRPSCFFDVSAELMLRAMRRARATARMVLEAAGRRR